MADERDRGPSIPRSTDEESIENAEEKYTDDESATEENIVIDTTSTEPLRESVIDEPSEDPRLRNIPPRIDRDVEPPRYRG